VSYLARFAALSSTPFTQADRVSPAFVAAREYVSRRSSDTRSVSHRRSPFSTAGLPLGRFGCSMSRIMYQQIIVDNAPVRVFNVPTLNKEASMEAKREELRSGMQVQYAGQPAVIVKMLKNGVRIAYEGRGIRLTLERDALVAQVDFLIAERDGWKQVSAEVARDAARYRYWRSEHGGIAVLVDGEQRTANGDELDQITDALIAP
jgi:hypothetical protein